MESEVGEVDEKGGVGDCGWLFDVLVPGESFVWTMGDTRALCFIASTELCVASVGPISIYHLIRNENG